MNSGKSKSRIKRFGAGPLLALVVMLGVAFLAVVMVPGFELASEVADSTQALKYVGQQQRQPTLVRASLDAMHDRLGARGYLQEAQEQLRDADSKLAAAVAQLTAPRPASWFALSGDTGAQGESMAGRRATQVRDIWVREHEVLAPVLAFKGLPYQDSEASASARPR